MARVEASYTPSGIQGLEVGRTSPVKRLLGPDWQLGWILVAPVFLIIAALLIYPFFDAIGLSFQDRFIGKAGHWIGVKNYTDLIRNPNSHFMKAAWNTVLITGGAITCKFFIGTAMACVLNQQIRGKNLWRGLMFLPWAVPAVVTAYAWRFMFDTSGPINGAIAQFHLRDDYVYFFNDAKIALPALILVIVWSGTPFWTMNILAGMQAIPGELYEAAELDGASTFQRFLHITMPSLKHVFLVTGLLSTIWTSANLVQILVLTGGGPNYSTMTLPLLAYLVAIPGARLGGGAAIAMTMLPAYLILVYFLTRQMLRQE
ncbi:MAG: carbohydrate ABC transporter permease [Thermomicrobiales bacterium]